MTLLRALIALSLLSLLSLQAAEPPLIKHEPVKVAEPGKPLSVVSHVEGNGSTVKIVYLHFSPSKDGTPIKTEMKPTGVGTYYGLIPAKYTQTSTKLYYYIEAGNTGGEWAETPWNIISFGEGGTGSPSVITPSVPPVTGPSYPYQKKERSKWFWPTVGLAGAAIIAGGVILADSGGDSGGSGGCGGGSNTSPTTFTQGANDGAAGSGLVLPKDTVIDATNSVTGRLINSVSVNITFNPVDAGAETFSIVYNGNVVFTSPSLTSTTSFNQTFNGNAPLVLIRVNTSVPDAQGRFFYSWNATATFNLAP
jgi:hypothetical protein